MYLYQSCTSIRRNCIMYDKLSMINPVLMRHPACAKCLNSCACIIQNKDLSRALILLIHVTRLVTNIRYVDAIFAKYHVPITKHWIRIQNNHTHSKGLKIKDKNSYMDLDSKYSLDHHLLQWFWADSKRISVTFCLQKFS